MTPYITIATLNTYTANGIHTMVMHHALHTSFADAEKWMKCICDTHNYTDLECDGTFGHFTAYHAKANNEDRRGYVEFEIWKENDITL